MRLSINITLQNVDRFGECICEQNNVLFMYKKSVVFMLRGGNQT